MRNLTVLVIALFFSGLGACNEHAPAQETDDAPAEHSHDINTLRSEVARYPDSLVLSQDLVEAYRNNGDYDSAIGLTRKLIVRDTGNAYLWNMMATLNYENGDTTATINALKKAIELYPLADYYYALGTIYARQGDSDAVDIADTLLAQGDDLNSKSSAYFIKSMYYNFTKQPDRAIKEADSSLSVSYNNMYAYREKAIALISKKQYRRAVDVLKKATTLQNSYDEGYFWMGQAYQQMGEKDSAIQSFRNALLFDKNYSKARDALDDLLKK